MIVLIVIVAIFLISFSAFLIRNWQYFKQLGQSTKWSEVGKKGKAVADYQKRNRG